MHVCDRDFQAIYTEFHPRILRYLSRLVGDADAEDLTQEVFLKVSHGLDGFRGDAQLSTWIYCIATNAAIDRLRTPAFRQAGSAAVLDEELSEPDSLSGQPCLPDEEVMRKEMYACFDNYLMDLPAAYRMVLILSELEELSNREIADILGVSLETVKIRLHRGRTMLFGQLKRHCKAEDWL